MNSFAKINYENTASDPSPLCSDTVTVEDEDMVDHPSHYSAYQKDGIECIDAMQSAFGSIAVANFCICNSFKYLWRHSSKGGMQDIDKAIWYLNKYKELNIIVEGE